MPKEFEMRKKIIFKKQEGMALVIALVMLLILTVIGINAINTTIFETNISGNQRLYNTAFYGADGGIDDFRATIDPKDPRGIRGEIMYGSITSHPGNPVPISGSNVRYNLTWVSLGEVTPGGVTYQVFRVNSEGVAPNFPTAGRVFVETIEEIDISGGGNVIEVKKYN